jgi:hypothetical protein
MLQFVKDKQKIAHKSRIVYLIANLNDPKNRFSLIANISKRRDICIKHLDADYFLMINADSKIDKCMLSKINHQLEITPKDLCIYKTKHGDGELPTYPFAVNRIDSLNFCVSSKIAKKIGYPKTVSFRALNDWRFFSKVFKECNGDYHFIKEVLGEFNANNRYVNVLSLLQTGSFRKLMFDYTSYCIKEGYSPGLLNVVKQILIVKAHFPERSLFKESICIAEKGAIT